MEDSLSKPHLCHSFHILFTYLFVFYFITLFLLLLSASGSASAFTIPAQSTTFTEDKDSRISVSSNNSNSSIKDEIDDNGSFVTSPSTEDISRQAQLLTELSKKVINIRELRRIASQGIPDGAGIRSTVWKLLQGYLPPDHSLWSSELAKKRSQYKHFKEDVLMNPSEITRRLEKSTIFENDDSDCENKGMLLRSEIPKGEHPLSLGMTSIWNQFFQWPEPLWKHQRRKSQF